MAEARINHVAMSMPFSTLDDTGRADIERFYGEVFGWTQHTVPEEAGNPLILLMSDRHLFLYLYPAEEGMVAPPLDHFGIEVFDEDELDEMLGRAKNFKEKDDRVRILEKKVTRYGTSADMAPELAGSTGVDLINCYIGYILPMMVEIQYFR
jgi:hypothetical protein